MHEKNKIVSYHDISDGGLLTTIAECCFAGHTGMSINIDKNFEINKFLFSEELGFVVQIEDKFLADFYMSLNSKVIEHYELGKVNSKYVLEIKNNKKIIYSNSIEKLHKIWHKNSFQIQLLRDNPKTSNDEFEKVGKKNLKGLYIKTNNNNKKKIINTKLKPKIAILKEQGVNGHYEMAQAFSMAGFDSYDVNMNSIIQKSFKLDNFQGVVFCGGFSFGDVLGAGSGWANKILHNSALKDEFQKFFSDQTKFSLGVCNGCQVLSKLTEIIPGTENWPNLCINDSERFESRYVMTKIVKSNSFFFDGMEGSELPIIVAHGEGKMQINNIDFSILEKNNQLSMRYIDNNGSITEKFPYNPNGSFKGITSVSSKSGNILMMMPHPERLLDIKQFPIYSNEKDSPWSKFFENAKKFVN
jgi:phosphoribosylformylglycinamidine synthase